MDPVGPSEPSRPQWADRPTKAQTMHPELLMSILPEDEEPPSSEPHGRPPPYGRSSEPVHHHGSSEPVHHHGSSEPVHHHGPDYYQLHGGTGAVVSFRSALEMLRKAHERELEVQVLRHSAVAAPQTRRHSSPPAPEPPHHAGAPAPELSVVAPEAQGSFVNNEPQKLEQQQTRVPLAEAKCEPEADAPQTSPPPTAGSMPAPLSSFWSADSSLAPAKLTRRRHIDEPVTQLLLEFAHPGWARKSREEMENKPFLTWLVETNTFNTICAIFILGNLLVMGLEANYAANNLSDIDGEVTVPFGAMHLVFTVCFILEMFIRFFASEKFIDFFTGKDWSWNVFDVVIVLLGTFESILTAFAVDALPGIEAMRVLRVLRMARAFRLIRMIRAFRELRLMIYSILRSGTFLAWSMVMLSVLIYIFAIYFVQSATAYRKDHGSSDTMVEMFGSLNNGAYYLFLSMSGGISWLEVEEQLYEVHWTNRIIMCLFIYFTVFALVNIITGIFVDVALNSAQKDRQEIIQDELRVKRQTIQKLYDTFVEADVDRDGTLTRQEFKIVTEKPEIQAVLSSLGMQVREARGLFELLDQDESGLLSLEEFIVGCMRISGGAKAVDLMALMYENKKMMHTWRIFMDDVSIRLDNQHEEQVELKRLIEALVASANQTISLV